MRGQPAPLMDVLPHEQQKICLQHRLDVTVTEMLTDCAPVFVINDAGGLVEHLPAPLPCEVAEIRILEIKWREQLVKSAQLEEFAAVECARTSATIERGIGGLDGGVNPMPHPQAALLPPAFG